MRKHNEVCVCCGRSMSEGEGMVCSICLNNDGPNPIPLNHIHIENSYTTWSTTMMYGKILIECYQKYHEVLATKVLNRSLISMYIEWFLHNIGYWLTLPFIKNSKIQTINERCKHVDLEEHTTKKVSNKK